ncbi:MAG TPA: hypothetical protein VG122_07905 [Gemmata sp.]|jgi:hypothetical protein|nr:hypothetical protein [Gemmata sp.]
MLTPFAQASANEDTNEIVLMETVGRMPELVKALQGADFLEPAALRQRVAGADASARTGW